jgi:PilZ domain-containing protein
MATTSNDPGSPKKPRRAPRVPGPYQGRRVGAINTDVTIHDLSLSGCLIESFHDVPVGVQMTLEIDLPSEGTIRVEAESVNTEPDFGFAVKFVEMTPQVRVHLARTVLHRLKKTAE